MSSEYRPKYGDMELYDNGLVDDYTRGINPEKTRRLDELLKREWANDRYETVYQALEALVKMLAELAEFLPILDQNEFEGFTKGVNGERLTEFLKIGIEKECLDVMRDFVESAKIRGPIPFWLYGQIISTLKTKVSGYLFAKMKSILDEAYFSSYVFGDEQPEETTTT